jgi:hypothetical protein
LTPSPSSPRCTYVYPRNSPARKSSSALSFHACAPRPPKSIRQRCTHEKLCEACGCSVVATRARTGRAGQLPHFVLEVRDVCRASQLEAASGDGGPDVLQAAARVADANGRAAAGAQARPQRVAALNLLESRARRRGTGGAAPAREYAFRRVCARAQAERVVGVRCAFEQLCKATTHVSGERRRHVAAEIDDASVRVEALA